MLVVKFRNPHFFSVWSLCLSALVYANWNRLVDQEWNIVKFFLVLTIQLKRPVNKISMNKIMNQKITGHHLSSTEVQNYLKKVQGSLV